MRYILVVVTLLEASDVTNNGRHLGFYQKLEIRLKPREMLFFCALHEKLVSTLHDVSLKVYFYCWNKFWKHVFSPKIGLTIWYLYVTPFPLPLLVRPRVKAANLIFSDFHVNWRKKKTQTNKDNKVKWLFCNMYIGKGGFSTLKQIGGLVRNRCLTLDKTGGNLALGARGREPSLLCYWIGIKLLTGG